ncbi:hypothetical protein EDD86DRAFT_188624 [Gorgonomyces haynaldii]|nr:hypothetical protein EDD86DRAFT_188624 [Gorgonomyces haynaldii]
MELRLEGDYKEFDGIIYRHGNGKYICKQTGTVYTGQWDQDKMSGKGRLEFPSGAVYDGLWKNNQYQGQGTYTWEDGSYVSGDWIDGCVSGQSKFTDPQGHGWVGQVTKGIKCVLAPELY